MFDIHKTSRFFVSLNPLFCHRIVGLGATTNSTVLYGAECSSDPAKNTALVERVLEDINMIPISSSLKVFAKCKAHLRKIGKIVDDAVILIGATAIDNKFVMVTENIKHFENLPGITLENWVKR